MNNEYVKLALTAAIAAVATWLVTKGTDTYDAGSEAQIRIVADAVIAEKLITDSGKTVAQEIGEIREGQIEIRANQRHILEAVRDLARE